MSRNVEPTACSLDALDTQDRIDEWRDVLSGVLRREPLIGGLRLTFARDAPVDRIARLLVAEQRRCPFFAFTLTVDRRGVAIEVTAPESGQDVLESLFGVASFV